jgi:phospholipase/carboxylesterase
MRRTEQTYNLTLDVPYVVMEPESGAAGKPLLVLIHGYSKSADSYAKLPRRISEDAFSYLVPQGPYRFKNPDGSAGHGWMISAGGQHDTVGRTRAEEMILSLVDESVARLGSSAVYLMGFSQGAFMASFLGMKYPGRFQGVVVQGGWRNPEVAQPLLDAGVTGARFFLQHGTEDRGITLDRGRELAEALAAAGAEVDWKTYPCGHELTRDILEDVHAYVSGTLEGAERV